MDFYYICIMEKEIIKLPIEDIKNNFNLYELELIDGKKIKSNKKNNYIFFYFTLFLFVGVLLTMLSPFKTFSFFYNKTNLDFFNPKVYVIKNKKIKRLIFFFVSLVLIILYPYICFFNMSFFDSELTNYDWSGLYSKINKEGYNPHKNSYIKVSKYKNYYICNDGNHRHKILESFFPKETMIDVIYEGQVFDN